MGNSDSKKRNQSLKEPRRSRDYTSRTDILKTKQNQITDDYDMMLKNQRILGTGINGKVTLCQHKATKKKYALKKLKDSHYARREIELQWRASIDCMHIVQIKDVYENKINNEKYLFVVLEYMEGGELFDRIKGRKTPFTEQEVGKIFKQIVTAVKHLHSLGIAHRDLKPENILLLTKDDKNFVVKISDFGFAKEAHKGLTTPNYTPYYVAPEILKFEKYDISCDIWSLGVILYILCSGTPPFYSMTGKKMSPGMETRILNAEFGFKSKEWLNVSEEAKSLIKQMLEPEPKVRLSIDDILNSEWMNNFSAAPKAKLRTISNLKVASDWDGFKEDIRIEMKERRINWDDNIIIKDLPTAKNPILERRKQKEKSKEKSIDVDKLANQSQLDNTITNNDSNNSNMKINKNSRVLPPLNVPQVVVSSSSNIQLHRAISEPLKLSPLTALYYSSNLKEKNDAITNKKN